MALFTFLRDQKILYFDIKDEVVFFFLIQNTLLKIHISHKMYQDAFKKKHYQFTMFYILYPYTFLNPSKYILRVNCVRKKIK